MTAQILDGKEIAKGVIARVKSETEALVHATGVTPGLAVIIVGDDPASHVYVSSKSRMAKECGFRSSQYTLEATTSQEELAGLVAKLNADTLVHGILVQQGSMPMRSFRRSIPPKTLMGSASPMPAS
jgi:methylenetetrahydrofolate dehydrogenase (NADP+) / methenyltetrahydrofolate cyclohydrolase